ncbi:MAG: hypothetical protein ACO20H_11910 [Bacteriovoracaceae bacterium]
MDLTLPYKKCKSAQEAYSRVKNNLTEDYIQKFKVKANIYYLDHKYEIEGTGKGFNLRLVFKENSCELQMKLSLLLRPIGKQVLNSVKKELQGLI